MLGEPGVSREPRDAGGSGYPEAWHNPEAAHMLQGHSQPRAAYSCCSPAQHSHPSSQTELSLTMNPPALAGHRPLPVPVSGAPNPQEPWLGVAVWPELSSAPPTTQQDVASTFCRLMTKVYFWRQVNIRGKRPAVGGPALPKGAPLRSGEL